MGSKSSDASSSGWGALDIFVFSNGNINTPPRKYHLEAAELQWWDKTLNHLANTHYGVKNENGNGKEKAKVHSTLDLYTLNGKKIKSPCELQNGMTYVAVSPHENFIHAGYEKYLMRANKSREKRERRKSSGSKEEDKPTNENFELKKEKEHNPGNEKKTSKTVQKENEQRSVVHKILDSSTGSVDTGKPMQKRLTSRTRQRSSSLDSPRLNKQAHSRKSSVSTSKLESLSMRSTDKEKELSQNYSTRKSYPPKTQHWPLLKIGNENNVTHKVDVPDNQSILLNDKGNIVTISNTEDRAIIVDPSIDQTRDTDNDIPSIDIDSDEIDFILLPSSHDTEKEKVGNERDISRKQFQPIIEECSVTTYKNLTNHDENLNPIIKEYSVTSYKHLTENTYENEKVTLNPVPKELISLPLTISPQQTLTTVNYSTLDKVEKEPDIELRSLPQKLSKSTELIVTSDKNSLEKNKKGSPEISQTASKKGSSGISEIADRKGLSGRSQTTSRKDSSGMSQIKSKRGSGMSQIANRKGSSGISQSAARQGSPGISKTASGKSSQISPINNRDIASNRVFNPNPKSDFAIKTKSPHKSEIANINTESLLKSSAKITNHSAEEKFKIDNTQKDQTNAVAVRSVKPVPTINLSEIANILSDSKEKKSNNFDETLIVANSIKSRNTSPITSPQGLKASQQRNTSPIRSPQGSGASRPRNTSSIITSQGSRPSQAPKYSPSAANHNKAITKRPTSPIKSRSKTATSNSNIRPTKSAPNNSTTYTNIDSTKKDKRVSLENDGAKPLLQDGAAVKLTKDDKGVSLKSDGVEPLSHDGATITDPFVTVVNNGRVMLLRLNIEVRNADGTMIAKINAHKSNSLSDIHKEMADKVSSNNQVGPDMAIGRDCCSHEDQIPVAENRIVLVKDLQPGRSPSIISVVTKGIQPVEYVVVSPKPSIASRVIQTSNSNRGQEAQTEQTIPLASYCSHSTSTCIIIKQDKCTQTEIENLMMEVHRHEDGRYSFRLPALETVKGYVM